MDEKEANALGIGCNLLFGLLIVGLGLAKLCGVGYSLLFGGVSLFLIGVVLAAKNNSACFPYFTLGIIGGVWGLFLVMPPAYAALVFGGLIVLFCIACLLTL